MALFPEPWTLFSNRKYVGFELTAPAALLTMYRKYQEMAFTAPAATLAAAGGFNKVAMSLRPRAMTARGDAGGRMAMEAPRYTLTARASSPHTGSFQLTLKRSTLRMEAGGGIRITSPEASLAMTATVPYFGSMRIRAPRARLAATGIDQGVNLMALAPMGATLEAHASTSIQCSIELHPGAYFLRATGDPGVSGSMVLHAPAATLRMGDLDVLVCHMTLTAPRMACSGEVDNFATVILRHVRGEVR
jgi:hypothetical protein